MNPGDVARLLGTCALYDYREVGKLDVAAWFKVIGGLDYDDAVEAVTRHYADSTDRIMPAHINRIVKQIREERQRREASRSDVLALPSRFDDDMGRQVQIQQGLAAARQVLGPVLAHLAERSPPQESAMEQLRELTAGPADPDLAGEVQS